MIRRKNKRNPENKILFLDHDGVMVLRDTDGDLNNWFDEKCVKVLNEIIRKTDCEIVVSSDWKNYFDLNELCNIYKKFGVIKCPISVTPNLYNKKINANDLEELRSKEIKQWLKLNPV